MMKFRKWAIVCLAALIAIIYALNASWIAGPPEGEMSFLAHRGVHQTYHRKRLTNTTCTAKRIDPPSHDYLENTVPSIQAAIDSGADIIEIDVKLTTDGEIVLFHDATLDCRTDGEGPTHKQTLADLKALDLGYGYTDDGGQTFPFRGRFVGAMPTLKEVLSMFPDTEFLVNLKHSKAKEGEIYADYLKTENVRRLGLVGNPRATKPVGLAYPEMVVLARAPAKACLKTYMLTGWFGHVPEACHDTYVPVPSNYRHVMWGWPYRFEKRLNAVGSRSLLFGPYDGLGSTGLDTPEQLRLIPKHYTGIVNTDKIEVVGPLLKTD